MKILKSLVIVFAMVAMVAGATSAYFSDTENIVGNSITTGTIGINVDGQQSFTLTDMKPGFVKYSDFTVTNDGSNPANITKKVILGSDSANLAGVLDYRLSVEVSNGWNQMLYNYDVTMADVAGQDMFLGMLPVGMSMKVNESYMMDVDAGNEYQDKTMSFDIVVVADQLKGSLTLENKNASNWDIVQGDSIEGTLTYGVMDQTFDYSFSGTGLMSNTDYTLVIGNDYPFTNGKLGSSLTDGSGNIVLSGSTDLGTITNQKVWLIPSTDWNGTAVFGWSPASYLFETGLIDYYKS